MNKIKSLQNLRGDIKVSVRLKLASLWTGIMFIYIYVDHFHLYMPSKVDEILKGRVFVFDTTQVILLIALVLVAIPVIMVFLSVALPKKADR